MGDFSKFLVTNFHTKEDQVFSDFLGYLQKYHFLVKTAIVTFWATFEHLGYF